MRGALGASRGRIVRQLLMESLVLSSAGAVLGLGLALTLIAWLAHQGSVALPLLSSLRIDSQALSWTVLVAVFTATIFGISEAFEGLTRKVAAKGARRRARAGSMIGYCIARLCKIAPITAIKPRI